VPPTGFKYLVTEIVCWTTGGPQKYTGKSMRDSHEHLKITSEEWEAFLNDFRKTLNEFKLPSQEQGNREQHSIGHCGLSAPGVGNIMKPAAAIYSGE